MEPLNALHWLKISVSARYELSSFYTEVFVADGIPGAFSARH